MLRILHTSDWHLGRTLEGHSRLPEQLEFIDELCQILDREQVDLVIVAGDVFDNYNPPAAAEELFYQALERMAADGSRAVVVIAGNHDSPERLTAARPLARKQGIFLAGIPGEELVLASQGKTEGAGLKQPGAVSVVAGGPGWLELSFPRREEKAVLVTLPYPSEKRLNQLLSRSLDEAAMQQAYSRRVAAALQQGAAHFRPDTVNIIASHLFVLGGITSESERDIQLGGAYVVEPVAIPAQAHYVALGHLHRSQAVRGTSAPCWYSGSPLCYSFSETDRPKEVLLVTATAGQPAEVVPIRLTSGKPMLKKKFASLQEAVQWCAMPDNQRAWVHLEIESPEPLLNSQLEQLTKLHQGLIFIRVLLPQVAQGTAGRSLAQLSLEEKFINYVARETGAAPAAELVQLFLELAHGGDDGEAH